MRTGTKLQGIIVILIFTVIFTGAGIYSIVKHSEYMVGIIMIFIGLFVVTRPIVNLIKNKSNEVYNTGDKSLESYPKPEKSSPFTKMMYRQGNTSTHINNGNSKKKHYSSNYLIKIIGKGIFLIAIIVLMSLQIVTALPLFNVEGLPIYFMLFFYGVPLLIFITLIIHNIIKPIIYYTKDIPNKNGNNSGVYIDQKQVEKNDPHIDYDPFE